MVTIKLRRGPSAEWLAANPVLADGEVGIESAPGVIPDKGKIGDGVTPWSSLPYSVSSDWIPLAEKGVAGGVASLDGLGLVPVAQLPGAAALDAEVTAAVTAHAASGTAHIGTSIAFTPTGTISATNVQDAIAEVASEASRVTTRRAPIILGTAGGEATNNTVNDTVFRYPFRTPVATTRWRLHVRNFNSRSNVAYSGALDFSGVWVGTHSLTALGAQTGNFTAVPVSALPAFTTDAAGAEYTSGWVTDPLAQFSPYTEHLLSVGWSCAASQVNMRSSAYAWFGSSKTFAGNQTITPGLASITVGLFDIWIECEYLSSNQLVVGYHGDSLTTGVNSGRPVFGSYPVQHALGCSHMAVLDSYSGTTLGEAVASFAQYRWTKFGIGSTVSLDASLVHLGGNDIFNGDAVATVQANLQSFINGLRTVYGVKAIYLATIMPRNVVGANETNRQTYNTWLRTLPCNVLGLFDFDAAVRDPTTGNILPAYNSGDNVHLSIAGYNAMARAVTVPLRRAA